VSTTTLHERYLTEQIGPDGTIESYGLVCPDDFNVGYDVIDQIAAAEPDRPALRWSDESGALEQYTFGDIARLSDQAASWFRSVGVRKGDRVLLVLKRHPQFWWAIIGLHKIGAVAAPATHQLKAYDLVFRLREAKITTVVATLEGSVSAEVDLAEAELGLTLVKAGVRGTKDGWRSFDEEIAQAPAFEPPTGSDRPVAADPMLLYFTSGTTAQPKMVQHDNSYPLAHIPTAKYWHKVDPDGLHLTVSDTGWAKSAWGKLYGQWILGACIDVFDFDRFDPDVLLRHLVDAGVTTFCAAPTIYRFLVSVDLASYDLSRLRHATIAGEAMNPVVYEKFRTATGLEIKEGYGQTESTLLVVTNYWQATKAGSMGVPSSIYEIALLGEDGTPVGVDEEGEICVKVADGRPIGLFDGYLESPDVTASVWYDGYYHTHDLATRDADGYFWYVGRTDDMIKTSGYRVGPFEVESVVMAHPAVKECAITGAPDPVRGVVVKATIVLAPGYEASDDLARDVQTFVKARTAPYKYPRIVEFVDAMPVTVSGKIRRVEIRQRDAG
jgi:acetyl-CoA synthetase